MTLDPMKRTNGAVHDDDNIKGFFAEYRWLSNFHAVLIPYNGLMYPSSEHAYMAQKTTDQELRKQFTTGTSADAKRLGRTIKLRADWEQVKFQVMEDILRQKFFTQPLKTMLIATGNKYLEETNYWNDRVWGVCNGSGENNLGKIIMKIRSELS